MGIPIFGVGLIAIAAAVPSVITVPLKILNAFFYYIFDAPAAKNVLRVWS